MSPLPITARSAPEVPFRSTFAPFSRLFRQAISSLACLFLLSPAISAAELKPKTLEAFQHYVQLTEARMQAELSNPAAFLYFDSLPENQRQLLRQKLAEGEIVIQGLETRNHHEKIHIPDGLVHHWLAIVFMPGIHLSPALTILQNYDRQAELYRPDVQRSTLLSRDGQNFKVYLRLHRKAIVTAVYNAEFDVQYFSLDATREYSRSYSSRIAEVEHPGEPEEREKPVGNDRGYLWRLYTYTRCEERDGGLYMQVEFIALSRSVPAIFAWLVNPYVKSIPREYLTNFLRVTRRELSATQSAHTPSP